MHNITMHPWLSISSTSVQKTSSVQPILAYSFIMCTQNWWSVIIVSHVCVSRENSHLCLASNLLFFFSIFIDRRIWRWSTSNRNERKFSMTSMNVFHVPKSCIFKLTFNAISDIFASIDIGRNFQMTKMLN